MNFWPVEVLESALECRHDFTLGSECGLLRHSAMKFTFGGVYLGTDFCVSASHGWCACDRRRLRPAIWRMLRVWWPQSGQEFRSRRSPPLRRPEFSISQSSWTEELDTPLMRQSMEVVIFTRPSCLMVTCSVLFRLRSTGIRRLREMISGAVSAFLVRQRIHELMRQFTVFGENRTFFPREGGPRIRRLMPRCQGQVPVSSCSELIFSFVAVVGDAIAASSLP